LLLKESDDPEALKKPITQQTVAQLARHNWGKFSPWPAIDRKNARRLNGTGFFATGVSQNICPQGL
jgi:hypothetical protein